MDRTKSNRVVHATDRKSTRLSNKNTCRTLARMPEMFDEVLFDMDRTERVGWN